MSWEDANAFCQWLSKKEGKTYRLPTDKEWSYAIGIGRDEKWTKDTKPEMLNGKVQNEFPWEGDYPPKTKDLAGNYVDTATKEKFPTQPFIEGYTDGFATTAPVMGFKPNKLGLYDMGGNACEWVNDWWNAAQKERALRGASFDNFDRGNLLTSRRFLRPPADRLMGNGFRCVVNLSAAAQAPEPVPPPVPAITSINPAATLALKDGITNTLGMKFVPVSGTDVLFCIHETRNKDYSVYAAKAPGVAET